MLFRKNFLPKVRQVYWIWWKEQSSSNILTTERICDETERNRKPVNQVQDSTYQQKQWFWPLQLYKRYSSKLQWSCFIKELSKNVRKQWRAELWGIWVMLKLPEGKQVEEAIPLKTVKIKCKITHKIIHLTRRKGFHLNHFNVWLLN